MGCLPKIHHNTHYQRYGVSAGNASQHTLSAVWGVCRKYIKTHPISGMGCLLKIHHNTTYQRYWVSAGNTSQHTLSAVWGVSGKYITTYTMNGMGCLQEIHHNTPYQQYGLSARNTSQHTLSAVWGVCQKYTMTHSISGMGCLLENETANGTSMTGIRNGMSLVTWHQEAVDSLRENNNNRKQGISPQSKKSQCKELTGTTKKKILR